jgi:hypothetical protein
MIKGPRDNLKFLDTPVIVITAYGNVGTERARQAGADQAYRVWPIEGLDPPAARIILLPG